MRLLYRTRQLTLLMGDLLSFFGGLWLALVIRRGTTPSLEVYQRHLSLFLILFVLWLVVNYVLGLYELGKLQERGALLRRTGESLFFSLLGGVTFFYLVPSPFITPKTILFFAVVLGYALAAGWRLLFVKLFMRGQQVTRILFVGHTPEVMELLTIIEQQPTLGYRVTGLIDPQPPTDCSVPTINTFDTVESHVQRLGADTVVVSPHAEQHATVQHALYALLLQRHHIIDLQSLYESLTGRVSLNIVSESWFLKNIENTSRPVYNKFRTGLDYLIAIPLGVVTLILFPFIAAAIKLTSPGPVLYSQERVGLDGSVFRMYKFRSMKALAADGSAETGGAQFASKKDSRITPVGNILRKTRLDELPQVINLLRRDISFIGPRPERPEIVAQLQQEMPYYNLRHLVRPGLAGWAVLHQHYADSIASSLVKLQYDLFYIKNRTALLDITILLKTIDHLLHAKGQ